MTTSFAARLRGAALLDAATYQELRTDERATGQAAIIVVAVSLAAGLAAGHLGGVLGGSVRALVSWLSWASVVHFVGTRIFDGSASWQALLRTLGFAQAPGILILLMLIPVMPIVVLPILFAWRLLAGVVAIRETFGFDTARAILTALLGALVLALVNMVVGMLMGLVM